MCKSEILYTQITEVDYQSLIFAVLCHEPQHNQIKHTGRQSLENCMYACMHVRSHQGHNAEDCKADIVHTHVTST